MSTRRRYLEQGLGFAAVLAFWALFFLAVHFITSDVAGRWERPAGPGSPVLGGAWEQHHDPEVRGPATWRSRPAPRGAELPLHQPHSWSSPVLLRVTGRPM